MSLKEALQDWWEEHNETVITSFVITVVSALFLSLLILFASCSLSNGPSHRDKLMYNNGTHNNCGGKWHFIEDGEDGTITYKCDKCGTTFTADDVVVIKGD